MNFFNLQFNSLIFNKIVLKIALQLNKNVQKLNFLTLKNKSIVINNYYKTRWNTKDVSNCITYHIFTIRINYQTKNVVRHKKQKLNIID